MCDHDGDETDGFRLNIATSPGDDEVIWILIRSLSPRFLSLSLFSDEVTCGKYLQTESVHTCKF